MPVRPVIEIAVDDEKFKAFRAEYDDYVQSLSLAEKAWSGSNHLVEWQLETLEKVVDLLQQQTSVMRSVVDAQNASTSAGQRQGAVFSRLETTSSHIAANFKSVGSSILHLSRLGMIGGAIGAAAGFAGSLFGLETLARDASNQRRASTGIGVSSGQLNAFSVNYAPYGDGASLLHNVADANRDIGQQWALRANGINPGGEGVADQALDLQRRARDLYRSMGSDHSTLAQRMQMSGLDQFMSMDEVQRLGSSSDDEFNSMQANTRRDMNRLGVSDPHLREWQELNVQLDRAKTSIENAFIDGLAPLTPELKGMSDALSEFVRGELTGPNVHRWIADIKWALDWAGSALSDPQLRAHLQNLPAELSFILGKLEDGAKMLGFVPKSGDTGWGVSSGGSGATSTADASKSASQSPYGVAGDGYPTTAADYARYMRRRMGLTVNGADQWGRIYGEQGFDPITAGMTPSAMPDQAHAREALRNVSGAYTLPSGMLYGQYGVESGFGKNLVNRASGAMGPFQFMAGTASQYGISNPMDFGQESEGAGRYMSTLLQKYHGDEDKALAAYNMGPGALDKVIASGAGDWHSRVSGGVRDYIAKVRSYQDDTASAPVAASASARSTVLNRQTPAQLALASKRNKPVVRVENRSGSNVIASSRMAAGPTYAP